MAVADEAELLLLRLLDEEYTRHPFYGSRKMVVWLRAQGHCVNRKRVQRLMRILGLVAMAPSPNTSKKHPQNAIYPYLLRGLSVARPNHVWGTDITYIRLAQGFVYLVAIIDWYSRTNSRRFRRSPGLAGVEHDGRPFLRGLPGRRTQGVWIAGNIQHRPGIAIHQRAMDQAVEGQRHPHQHGRAW